MIIDTHIHLSHFLYDDTFPFLLFENGQYQIRSETRDGLIHRIINAGVVACIDPGIDIESNKKILDLAYRFPNIVFSAIGIHPTRTFQYRGLNKDGKVVDKKLHWHQRHTIEEFSNAQHVVAIGETGLDYHQRRKDQHRFRQIMWFVWQIKLAHKKRLPIILHVREADTDALRILKWCRRYLHGGVCHCFYGTPETAKQYTELGFKLGIGGTLLKESPNKKLFEEAIKQTPLEYILLETDGPYVKPYCPDLPKKQVQKARNTSLILSEVVSRIGELKGIDRAKVEKVTTENAIRVFCLKNDYCGEPKR